MRTLRKGLLLVGFLVLLIVAVPAGAENTQTYQDSVGEGSGDPTVPDITTTTVSNDDAGMITFKVDIPNVPQLTRDVLVDMLVDTDSNPATGDPQSLGADYAIELFLGEVSLFKWDGTNFTRRVGDPPATTLVYSWSSGPTIKISAAELGNTKKFGFDVLVVNGLVVDDTTGNIDWTNAKSDVAPAFSSGLYSYEVKVAPAQLVFKSLSMSPARPKEGKPFKVLMSATRSDTGAAISGGEVACTARAGTKAVKVKSAKFVGTRAVCIFQVPPKTKGKMLRGKITMTFEGKKLARPFSAKIR
jgi:hypothetical protein